MAHRALTDKQIEWAYKQWNENYRTWEEIAKALFVTTQTLKNSVYKYYGHSHEKWIRKREPLVYKEE